MVSDGTSTTALAPGLIGLLLNIGLWVLRKMGTLAPIPVDDLLRFADLVLDPGDVLDAGAILERHRKTLL